MRLLEFIGVMESAAMEQPSVNMIVRNDVYRISKAPDRRYGIFAWTQMEHRGSWSSDMMKYRFSLFYVDRLTEDRRNEIEVQSVGIETLDNIVRGLCGSVDAGDWTFRAFTERFTDECAGAWCDVSFLVPVSRTCADTFPDFSRLDYNNDFLIF